MSSLFKYAVILAAFALLVVLITPVPDELPCTAGHKSPALTAMLAGATLPLAAELSASSSSILRKNLPHVVEDMSSVMCTFLC